MLTVGFAVFGIEGAIAGRMICSKSSCAENFKVIQAYVIHGRVGYPQEW